jgi:hypothetical protein
LSGTVEVVPNPNGGGIGVPISSWVNNNPPDHPECPSTADPITPISGSYSTCERQEWYGMDTYPEDYLCPTAQCECKKGEDKLLSYASGSERVLGIDIVPDEDFPCDLFEYSFGFLKDTQWEKVKSEVPNQLTDCSSLDKQSSGYYWVSGSSCVLSGQIGTAKAPVFLISAAEETKVSATAEFFGVLFVTDVEHPGTAEFTGNGTATIYGAAIMDAEMKNFNGTFQIVYLENVLGLAYDTGAFGAVAGGWTDFHAAWR